MNFEEYRVSALRTAASLTPAEKLINAALGLHGEPGEIADTVKKARFQGHAIDEAKIANEIGDVLWYIALAVSGLKEGGLNGLADFNDGDHFDLGEPHAPMTDLLSDTLNFCSHAAWVSGMLYAVVQNKDPHREYDMIIWLIDTLAVFAKHFNVTLERCAALNIEKLRRRYPDGFSAERSLNRED